VLAETNGNLSEYMGFVDLFGCCYLFVCVSLFLDPPIAPPYNFLQLLILSLIDPLPRGVVAAKLVFRWFSGSKLKSGLSHV